MTWLGNMNTNIFVRFDIRKNPDMGLFPLLHEIILSSVQALYVQCGFTHAEPAYMAAELASGQDITYRHIHTPVQIDGCSQHPFLCQKLLNISLMFLSYLCTKYSTHL